MKFDLDEWYDQNRPFVILFPLKLASIKPLSLPVYIRGATESSEAV